MNASELVKYFANKNMGSFYLNTVHVIWEALDEVEKQMVKSLKEAKTCGNLLIYSNLKQEELNAAVANTPYISL